MSDPHISFRKPKCIVEDSCMSWSGKYYCYLGRHYHEAGKECWIVGVQHILRDERRERHYSEFNGSPDPKAAALIYWSEFSTKMQRAPEWEETDEVELEIKRFLEREGERKGYTGSAESTNNIV